MLVLLFKIVKSKLDIIQVYCLALDLANRYLPFFLMSQGIITQKIEV